jgi:hypothetical protein
MLSRWGPAGALVVGLVAAVPLARVPFFASDDGLVHVWRLWEYARVAGLGYLPPRWAPDAAYGFGTPIFTFYNPLAYALGAVPVLLGATAADATKLVFALSLVLSALGAYFLGAAWNRRFPLAAGLTSALLYTLIPYRLATVYQRGALAESLGLALAPWVVLFALRAAEVGRPARAAPLALAVGALILSHTIAALLTLPFAGALALARLLEIPRPQRPTGLLVLSLGLALGVALGALYWLPAFAEQSTVHLDRARWTEVGGGFLGSFQWPWQLVQATPLHDYAADVAESRMAPDRFPRLPLVAAVTLLLGLTAGLWRGALRRAAGLVVLLGLLVALGLAAPPALPLWRTFELLAAVQLGWRFLAVILLMAIPLAASLPDLPVRGAPFLAVTLGLATAAASLVNLPVQSTPWSVARERPAELSFFERKTGEFALGALREYVPRGADLTPEQLTLEPADSAGASTAEIDVGLVAADPVRRVYDVATAVPSTLLLDLFAHPSLGATLDGSPAILRSVSDDGLAAVDLPPGQHRLEIAPRPTPLERTAGWLAVAALVGSLALAATGLRFATTAPFRRAAPIPALVLAVTALAFTAPSAFPRSARGAGNTSDLLLPSNPLPLDRAHLLGAFVDSSLVPSLGTLTVDLHLQSLAQPSRNEPVALRLLSPTGAVVAEEIGGPAGGLRPTSRWRPNELLRLRQELRLPPGSLAGRYTLAAEVAGTTATLGTIDLPAAGSAPPPQLTEPFTRFESLFGDDLVLDGYAYDPAATARPLRGSFWWRRLADGAALYDATLRLVDKQGRPLAEETRRMGGAGNIRPQADFSLLTAGALPPESYRLEVLVRPAGASTPLKARTFEGSPSDALVLTWLYVPEPCDCVPVVGATPLNAQFADGISLAAYATARRLDDAELTLYWRADARPSRDYVAFVHLLDGDRIVAQIDDMPNGGNRPTGRWQAGDVVPDRYHLRPSSGRATAFEVGLYSHGSNQRLPLVPATASNAVVLPLPPESR